MTDTVTILLGVLAACAAISTLMLISCAIVIDAHLTSISNSLIDIKAELWNSSGTLEDVTDDYLDDKDPPPSVAAIYKREPTAAEVAYAQELERELQERGME